MTTPITWSISALNCSTTEQNPDTVIVVHWRCTGTDGTYTGTVYSTASVPAPTGTFTPYADLTQDIVLGWIWSSGVDKDSAEAAVQTQIDNAKNPPVVSPQLPWAA